MALATVVCINRICPSFNLNSEPTVRLNHFIFISEATIVDTGFRNGLAFCDKCASYALVVIQIAANYLGRIVNEADEDPFFYSDLERANRNNHLLPRAIPFPFVPEFPPPIFLGNLNRAPQTLIDIVCAERISSPVRNPIFPISRPVSPVGNHISPVNRPISPVANLISPINRPVSPVGALMPVSPVSSHFSPVSNTFSHISSVSSVNSPFFPISIPSSPIKNPF